jgi:BppU N-terminal domain
MSDKIKLVQGDTRPSIQVTLTDENTGNVIDITGATIKMFFRAVGSTAILDTLNGVITNPTGGVVVFSWNSNTLATADGQYEGEVQTTFADNTIQTAYSLLKFVVRADF